MRLGGIFVAACMMLIAGAVGAVAYFTFGVTLPEAAIVALAMLTTLAIYNAVTRPLRASARAAREIADLGRGIADVAHQVAELGRRLTALEVRVEVQLHRPQPAPAPAPAPAVEPLAFEFEEVGTLMRQLADTVSTHESQLAQLARAIQPSSPKQSAGTVASESPAPQVPAAAAVVAAAKPATVEATEAAQEQMLGVIRGAIAGSRVDLYLQPIVTLPQRKARYYEALARLRGERGEVIAAADFIATAERARLLPQIDNLMIFRCVQVVRRLLAKSREVGLFCNISTTTLADPVVFTQLVEFLDANRAIAPSIVLEFTQSAIRDAGPIENEGLEALAERGFRFSLDNVTDLRIEPRTLATRGFRFVKVPGSLLLDHSEGGSGDIHPADLADLLARFGMELIADKIESEAVVVDLLDYDVRYGQGYLFSPPRPVRAEALQGAAERGDVVETPVPAAPEPRPPRSSGLAQLARRV
jgi:cyclic-di-GMP phosphodiesterase TipF (flagellum assembly factor)